MVHVLTPLRGNQSPLVVTREVLQSAGILKEGYRERIKVLGGGVISFAIELQGIEASKSAKAEIEKAGGKVQ